MNPLDLLLLACPAMMVLCVIGMRGQGRDEAARSPAGRFEAPPAGGALETRLADLMVENDDLRRRLDAVSATPSAAAPTPETAGRSWAAKDGG